MLVSRSELLGKVLATAKVLVLIPEDKIRDWEDGRLYVNIWDDEDLPHMGTYSDFEQLITDPDPRYDRFRKHREENFKLQEVYGGQKKYTINININDEIRVGGKMHSVLDKDCDRVTDCDIMIDVFRNCGIVSTDSDELLNWEFGDTYMPDGNGMCAVILLDVEDFTDFYHRDKADAFQIPKVWKRLYSPSMS